MPLMETMEECGNQSDFEETTTEAVGRVICKPCPSIITNPLLKASSVRITEASPVVLLLQWQLLKMNALIESHSKDVNVCTVVLTVEDWMKNQQSDNFAQRRRMGKRLEE